MSALMVEAAERDGEVQIRCAFSTPRILVMQLAPGIGAVAPLRGALVITGRESDALRLAEEAVLSPEVERQ